MAARRYEVMGSTSMSSPGSSDSLNGLKFGQKIYFGDVALGGSSSAATPGKKGRAAAQSGQPPRCQVEGCDLDLSDAKAYYSRHKVCCPHSKSSKVIVGGIQQRFCQQCSRFHQVAEFDNDKRSCRRRLAGHNERRRKPPPGSLLSTRLGRLSPTVFDGGGGSSSSNGFLVDFTSSLKAPPGSGGRSSWPGSTKAPENIHHHLQGAWAGGAHAYLHQSSATGGVGAHNYTVGPTIPSGECFAGVTDSSCALSLLSSQDWSSGNHRAPPPLNTGHFPDNHHHHHHHNSNPWGFKVGEPSHGLNSETSNLGLGQLPHHHHHLSSRSSGDELDMGQPGGDATGRQLVEFEHPGAYGSSSSTDHMNWLL